jgi:hypothetical protein
MLIRFAVRFYKSEKRSVLSPLIFIYFYRLLSLVIALSLSAAFDFHRLSSIFIACHRSSSLVIALSLEAQRTIRVAA